MRLAPEVLINLERYPIDRPHDPATLSLIERLQVDLESKALALLPDFLRPDALSVIVAELNRLVPQAHLNERLRTPYGWMDNREFPEDHPRRALHRMRYRTITRDLLGWEATLVAIYEWNVLTEFVRRVFSFETLFRTVDPWLSTLAIVEDEDSERPWHFDSNDGVVSLLLQAADDGGAFEYVPYVRDEDAESYEEVAQVFAGTSDRIIRPPIQPGTLTLFRGRRSVHRVTRVGLTTKPRMIGILTYDHSPGTVFPEATVRSDLGQDSEPHFGTHRSGDA